MNLLPGLRQTILPAKDAKDGPLPPMLLGMTVVTGLVDAVSYLVLGHVFVANMTGNIVFLGFALAGAPGFSIAASLVALAFFALGALLGGSISARFDSHRGRLLSTAATVQSALLVASIILALLGTNPLSDGFRYALIAVLALGMGTQNSTARKLAVPDLTTTVLTLTITGIASDIVAGQKGPAAVRRGLSVTAMLAGAFVGALCVVRNLTSIPLMIAAAITVAVAAASRILGASSPAWVNH